MAWLTEALNSYELRVVGWCRRGVCSGPGQTERAFRNSGDPATFG